MDALRPARDSDLDALLALQRVYYAEDGYPFHESILRAAWAALLNDPDLGRAWVIEPQHEIVGYVVLTFGYSLEFGGRTAFIDELFVLAPHRGHGLGAAALDAAEAACREIGIGALHLEVERDKTRTQEFYRRRGHVDHQRYLMTKWLTRT